MTPGGSTAARPRPSAARAVAAKVSNSRLTVALKDGREIAVPLERFPRLVRATEKQRKNYELLGGGRLIRWPDVTRTSPSKGCCAARPRWSLSRAEYPHRPRFGRIRELPIPGNPSPDVLPPRDASRPELAARHPQRAGARLPALHTRLPAWLRRSLLRLQNRYAPSLLLRLKLRHYRS